MGRWFLGELAGERKGLVTVPGYCRADIAVVVAVVMMVVLRDGPIVVETASRAVKDTNTSPTCKQVETLFTAHSLVVNSNNLSNEA